MSGRRQRVSVWQYKSWRRSHSLLCQACVLLCFTGITVTLTSRSHRVDKHLGDLATDELSSTLNRRSSCLWLPPVSTPHFLGWGQSGKDMEERILSIPVLVRLRGLLFSGPTGIPWLFWWILYFSVWSHLTKLCSRVQHLRCHLKTDIVYVLS